MSIHPENAIEPPWTQDQVASLNAFQEDGRMHEFTCNIAHAGSRELTATEVGWVCSVCPYVQHWAYDWMANWAWQKMLDDIYSRICRPGAADDVIGRG